MTENQTTEQFIIPIVQQYQHEKVVGGLYIVNGKLIARLIEPITTAEVFQIFGAIGFTVTKFSVAENGERLFNEIEIFCYSTGVL